MDEGTGLAAPSAEHMLGHGFYNKHAEAQGAANRFGLALIEQAIARVDLARAGGVVRIADYGAAQGGNSLLPIGTALSALSARGSALPVVVTHTDLSTNDWTTLFQTVLSSPQSYVAGRPDVFVAASGTSIYRQIFPPAQIAFGYSAIASHWLSRKPADIAGHIWSVRATGAVRDRWAECAREDWYTFLRHRAAELLPSGQLVMVNSGADARGQSGAEPLVDVANKVLRDLVAEGILGEAEYGRMAIPTYYRVEREWREPFDDPAFVRAHPLELVHYEESALRDVQVERYEATRDAAAFARSDAAFFRAAFEPALFAALREERDEADRARLSEAFAARLEVALAHDPASHGARWVLQLMWIARAGG
jgi:salicylate 1-O-methyltransferase